MPPPPHPVSMFQHGHINPAVFLKAETFLMSVQSFLPFQHRQSPVSHLILTDQAATRQDGYAVGLFWCPTLLQSESLRFLFVGSVGCVLTPHRVAAWTENLETPSVEWALCLLALLA